MSYFAGFVKGVASQMGIPIRWGGDWNSDNNLKDNKFDDLPHFELKDII
jgi:peptidoglycan L-alanyl-D-glutamate endopeptidase CwlK